jgi:hypothetical protein
MNMTSTKVPAKRHKKFPIGRICMICGRGGTVRLGGCYGSAHALLALGYRWDRTETLGYAHNCCLERKRKEIS